MKSIIIIIIIIFFLLLIALAVAAAVLMVRQQRQQQWQQKREQRQCGDVGVDCGSGFSYGVEKARLVPRRERQRSPAAAADAAAAAADGSLASCFSLVLWCIFCHLGSLALVVVCVCVPAFGVVCLSAAGTAIMYPQFWNAERICL